MALTRKELCRLQRCWGSSKGSSSLESRVEAPSGSGVVASLPCQDDSVPVPKNNAQLGLPQRKHREQPMCKGCVERGKWSRVWLITPSYF